MSQLLDQLRILIEDESAEDFTDAQCQMYLNKYRGYTEGYSLSAESTDYLVWISPYKYLDNRSLRSGSDSSTVISEDDYTADDINGIFTFTKEQSAVYLYANYFNLYQTAADMWLVRAAQATHSGKIKLGDEELPMDKYNKEYCIGKYWNLCTSSSMQMERGY